MADKQEHPQAKWLRAIADGEQLQKQYQSGCWLPFAEDLLLTQIADCGFVGDDVRIKPQTITIGKYEVAEPMKVAPEMDTVYFYLSSHFSGGADSSRWEGAFASETNQLKNGMCWLKREDAELAAKAITELLLGT